MNELETKKVENWTNEAGKAGISENGTTNENSDVVLKHEGRLLNWNDIICLPTTRCKRMVKLGM